MAGISTKGVYGVIATYYIYSHQCSSAVKSVEIAAKMELPQNYLEQILLILKNANILKSIRGAKGGYVLAREAKDITVLEIIEALDGSICDFDTGNNRDCKLLSFWDEARKGIKEQFNIPISKLDEYTNNYNNFTYMI
ncbi:RrF2 family transcriptional regulator [Arcobacter sp. FWKO B]|uniref:RrF2 family transcriptional regulator n=1 Tax=Arcobacter sp. FWKO B TaxID=2593672 RepID=UPI0018A3BBC0|nr:Rrf2 family transcriptional regulator [Arcobacter sp. FWKO B]QOG11790.1 Rrf2 family transcriptional regulator [Arcobacter sp. FWKO B]